ncbi:hypothetical protein [Segnochrobactrum spirostomi]|uniref:Uncharacterized protein n=1 Tax=Segnochrobactrum spirostomi TaxID=2608987 RepID=A0A6A7Y8Z7_9HYPH|nr:hypothetical protein [Segnochrobactrum spirostomi]MQT14458.1 hypothetical protein [Segnochrobactrum spirostomi]
MRHRGWLLGTLAATALFAAADASAQTAAPADAPPPGLSDAQKKQLYDAAHNQLGVLEFCAGQSFVGTDVVELQRRAIAVLPTPPDTSGGDEAERAGQLGIVMASGQTLTLETAAKSRNTTIAALCAAIAKSLEAATAGGVP